MKTMRPSSREICNLLKLGKKPHEIVALTGVVRTRVWYWRKKLGMPKFKKGRFPYLHDTNGALLKSSKLSLQNREMILEKMALGISQSEIARSIGVPRQRINQVVYPDKHKARVAINSAIKSGKMQRPTTCSNCGSGGRMTAHHDNYSAPLEVKWLCAKCHFTLPKNRWEYRKFLLVSK